MNARQEPGQDAGPNGHQLTVPAEAAPAAAAASDAAPGSLNLPVSASAQAAPAARIAPAQATTAPAMSPEVEIENLNRLVESMRVQSRQGIPEATIRLRPEHFGEVTISIRVERGAVSAVMQADTPAAQQWLESHEERLRSSLADQGLNLEKYVVQRDRQQQEQPRDQRRQTPARYRQRDDQPAERFEVTV